MKHLGNGQGCKNLGPACGKPHAPHEQPSVGSRDAIPPRRAQKFKVLYKFITLRIVLNQNLQRPFCLIGQHVGLRRFQIGA